MSGNISNRNKSNLFFIVSDKSLIQKILSDKINSPPGPGLDPNPKDKNITIGYLSKT